MPSCVNALEILMTMQKSALVFLLLLLRLVHFFRAISNWQWTDNAFQLKWLGWREKKIAVIAMNWFDFTGALAHSDYIARSESVFHLAFSFIGSSSSSSWPSSSLSCAPCHYWCHYRNTNDVNWWFVQSALFSIVIFCLMCVSVSCFLPQICRCVSINVLFVFGSGKKWCKIDKNIHFWDGSAFKECVNN